MTRPFLRSEIIGLYGKGDVILIAYENVEELSRGSAIMFFTGGSSGGMVTLSGKNEGHVH